MKLAIIRYVTVFLFAFLIFPVCVSKLYVKVLDPYYPIASQIEDLYRAAEVALC